jgi:hypothetical protein
MTTPYTPIDRNALLNNTVNGLGSPQDYLSNINGDTLKNASFLADVRKAYKLYDGRDFASDDDAVRHFLTGFRWSNNNTIGMLRDWAEQSTMPDEQKQLFARLQRVYDELPWFVDETGQRSLGGFVDAALPAIIDPTNLIGGMAAKPAAMAAGLAGKTVTKAALTGAAKGVGTEFAVNAGISGVQDAIIQNRAIDQGLQEDFSWLQSLASAGLGGAAGAAIVGGGIGIGSAFGGSVHYGAKQGAAARAALTRLGYTPEDISKMSMDQVVGTISGGIRNPVAVAAEEKAAQEAAAEAARKNVEGISQDLGAAQEAIPTPKSVPEIIDERKRGLSEELRNLAAKNAATPIEDYDAQRAAIIERQAKLNRIFGGDAAIDQIAAQIAELKAKDAYGNAEQIAELEAQSTEIAGIRDALANSQNPEEDIARLLGENTLLGGAPGEDSSSVSTGVSSDSDQNPIKEQTKETQAEPQANASEAQAVAGMSLNDALTALEAEGIERPAAAALLREATAEMRGARDKESRQKRSESYASIVAKHSGQGAARQKFSAVIDAIGESDLHDTSTIQALIEADEDMAKHADMIWGEYNRLIEARTAAEKAKPSPKGNTVSKIDFGMPDDEVFLTALEDFLKTQIRKNPDLTQAQLKDKARAFKEVWDLEGRKSDIATEKAVAREESGGVNSISGRILQGQGQGKATGGMSKSKPGTEWEEKAGGEFIGKPPSKGAFNEMEIKARVEKMANEAMFKEADIKKAAVNTKKRDPRGVPPQFIKWNGSTMVTADNVEVKRGDNIWYNPADQKFWFDLQNAGVAETPTNRDTLGHHLKASRPKIVGNTRGNAIKEATGQRTKEQAIELSNQNSRLAVQFDKGYAYRGKTYASLNDLPFIGAAKGGSMNSRLPSSGNGSLSPRAQEIADAMSKHKGDPVKLIKALREIKDRYDALGNQAPTPTPVPGRPNERPAGHVAAIVPKGSLEKAGPGDLIKGARVQGKTQDVPNVHDILIGKSDPNAWEKVWVPAGTKAESLIADGVMRLDGTPLVPGKGGISDTPAMRPLTVSEAQAAKVRIPEDHLWAVELMDALESDTPPYRDVKNGTFEVSQYDIKKTLTFLHIAETRAPRGSEQSFTSGFDYYNGGYTHLDRLNAIIALEAVAQPIQSTRATKDGALKTLSYLFGNHAEDLVAIQDFLRRANLDNDAYPMISSERGDSGGHYQPMGDAVGDQNVSHISIGDNNQSTPRYHVFVHEFGHWAYDHILTGPERSDFMRWFTNNMIGSEISPDFASIAPYAKTRDDFKAYTNIRPNEFFADSFNKWVHQRGKNNSPELFPLFRKVLNFLRSFIERYLDPAASFPPELEKLFERILPPETVRRNFRAPKTGAGKVLHRLATAVEDTRIKLEESLRSGHIGSMQDGMKEAMASLEAIRSSDLGVGKKAGAMLQEAAADLNNLYNRPVNGVPDYYKLLKRANDMAFSLRDFADDINDYYNGIEGGNIMLAADDPLRAANSGQPGNTFRDFVMRLRDVRDDINNILASATKEDGDFPPDMFRRAVDIAVYLDQDFNTLRAVGWLKGGERMNNLRAEAMKRKSSGEHYDDIWNSYAKLPEKGTADLADDLWSLLGGRPSAIKKASSAEDRANMKAAAYAKRNDMGSPTEIANILESLYDILEVADISVSRKFKRAEGVDMDTGERAIARGQAGIGKRRKMLATLVTSIKGAIDEFAPEHSAEVGKFLHHGKVMQAALKAMSALPDGSAKKRLAARLGQLQDELNNVLTASRKDAPAPTSKLILSASPLGAKQEGDLIIAAANEEPNSLAVRAIGFEFARRANTMPAPGPRVDVRPEFQALTDAQLSDALHRAYDDADAQAINELAEEGMRRNTDGTPGKPILYIRESLVASAVERERHHGIGIPDDDGIDQFAPQWQKDILRRIRHNDGRKQYTMRKMLSRAMNLLPAELRGRMEDVAIMSVADLQRLTGQKIDPKAAGAFLQVGADAFPALRNKLANIAIGLVDGTATPLDAIHEMLHFALRTRIFSPEDQAAIIAAHQAAAQANDPLAVKIGVAYGDDALKNAEEWFVEAAAQHVIGRVAKGDIYKARDLGKEADLELRSRLGQIIQRLIDTAAYIFNGLIGNRDVRQLMRRLTMYGDMVHGGVRDTDWVSDALRNARDLPPFMQAAAMNAVPVSRRAAMKEFASGLGLSASGKVVYWFHGSPAGKYLSKTSNKGVILAPSERGHYGPGLHLTRSLIVADETYAQANTVEAIIKLWERGGRRGDQNDVMDVAIYRADLVSQMRTLSAEIDAMSKAAHSSRLGNADEIEAAAAVPSTSLASKQRDLRRMVKDFESTNAILRHHNALPEPITLQTVVRTGDLGDTILDIRETAPKLFIDSEPVMRVLDVLDQFGESTGITQSNIEYLVSKLDAQGGIEAVSLRQFIKEAYMLSAQDNDPNYFNMNEVEIETRADQKTADLLAMAGYEGLLTHHHNRVHSGNRLRHETLILFEPEGKVKSVDADYFDEKRPGLYESRPINTLGEMSIIGELGRMAIMADGPLVSANAGPMLSMLSASGVSKPVVSALSKVFSKKVPNSLERKALARSGFFHILSNNAERLRKVSGAKTVADWLQPKSGVGHFDRLIGMTADDVMPILKELGELDKSGALVEWMRHNKFWGKSPQPKVFNDIARALRRGPASDTWKNLSPEAQQAASNIRAAFARKLEQLRDAGMAIGRIQDYFPQVWDAELMKAKSERAVELIAAYLKKESKLDPDRSEIDIGEATRRATGIVQTLISEEGVYTPPHSDTRVPVGDHIDYQRMIRLHDPRFREELAKFEEEGFLIDDLKGVVVKYMDSANRRLDFLNRWGINNHGFHDYATVAAHGLEGVRQLLTTKKVLRVKRDFVTDNGVDTNTEVLTMMSALHPHVAMAAADKVFELTQAGDRQGAINHLMVVQPYPTRTYEIRANAIVDALMDFADGIGRDPKGNAPGMHENELKFMHEFFRVSQRKQMELGYGGETARNISSGIRSFNSMTLLSATTLASFPDTAMSAIRSGNMRAWVKGLANYASNPNYRAAMKNIGANVESIIHSNMAMLYGGTGSRASNAFFNGIGLTPWTSWQGTMASAVGWEAFKAEQKNALSNLPINGKYTLRYRTAYRFLKRYGMEQYAEAGAKSLEAIDINSPEAAPIRAALHKFRSETIFATNPSDIPLWAQTPWGSLVFQLKAYPLMFSRLIGDVMNEAFGKSTIHGKEVWNLNFGPLLAMMTLGTGFGMASMATRDLIQGRGGNDKDKEHAFRDRSLTALAEQFGYEADIHGPMDKAVGWYLEGLMAMGGLGLIGDIIYNTAAQADNGAFGTLRTISALGGPVAGLGIDAYSTLFQGGQAFIEDATGNGDGSNYKERDALRTAASRIPILGGFHTVRQAAADLAGPRSSDSDSGGWGSGW